MTPVTDATQPSRTVHTKPILRRRRDAVAKLNRLCTQRAIELFRVKPKVRPSVWSEANIVLDRDEAMDLCGPYRFAVKPWLRAVLDAKYDNPEKRGVIIMKPSQVMVTRAVLNVLFYYAMCDPSNLLYMLDTRSKSGETAVDKWKKTVDANPSIARLFSLQSKSRSELKLNKKFPGGRWDFVGGGSVGDVISFTYPRVFLDEYDRITKLFKSKETGSVWTVAKGRTKAFPDREEIWCFSHPTQWDRGVAERWLTQSDQRSWSIDCPHCGKLVQFKSFVDQVKIEFDDKGRLIPESAELLCGSCSKVITDSQRSQAVWPQELGGVGRFETELDEAMYRARPYVGLWIHRLADPDVTVVNLARELASCTSEEDRRGVYNVTLGEPFNMSAVDASKETLEASLKPMDKIVMRAGVGGARILTFGIDVQFSKANPILVYQGRVYDASGNAFVVALGAVSGFDAMAALLRDFSVPCVDDDGRELAPLTPNVVGIDCAWGTGLVLDFCRWTIMNKVSNARIPLIALRYSDHVDADAPIVMAPDHKRKKKGAEHLGMVKYYYLSRQAWVDVEQRRMSEGRLHVVCQAPTEFLDHYRANAKQMVEVKKKWGNSREERWQIIKGKSDDFMQAGAYSEVGAAAECGLYSLGETEYAPAVVAKDPGKSVQGQQREWLKRRMDWLNVRR